MVFKYYTMEIQNTLTIMLHWILPLFLSFVSAIDKDCGPLCDYVWAPDDHYSYKHIDTQKGYGVTFFTLNMTSQKWYDETVHSHPVWWHYLTVAVPNEIQSYDHAVIIIEGGSNTDSPPKPNEEWMALCNLIALTTGHVCGLLNQIPNQPIRFWDDPENRNRKEDALIAWTWKEFMLNNSDAEFLLRLPMTKAVIKAFDTVTSFTKEVDVRFDVQKYAVLGGSKRGWVSWTTAAVGDERLIATIPIVLTMLNMTHTMMHHWQAYGGWSWVMKDYWELNITEYVTDPAMQRLADVVDPITYADRMLVPKFVVCAAGDEFFLPDESHYFWGALQEPKYLRVVPNMEHGVVTRIISVFRSISAFYVAVATGYPLPKFTWTREVNEAKTGGRIILHTETPASRVTAWRAKTTHNERRDFRLLRPAEWNPDIVLPQFVIWFPDPVQDLGNGTYIAEYEAPDEGWLGFLMEMKFPGPNGMDLIFSTEVEILPDIMPFPPCEGWECHGDLV